MRKILIFILSFVLCFSLCVCPVYAATTVDGVSYPILLSGGSSFYGINAQSIDQVDSFSITVNSSSTITYYVNLLTSSGSCRFGTSFSSDNVCRLTYNGVSEALSRSGYSISDLRGVMVNANTADSYSVLYDAVEKSSILTGLIRWLTDAFDSVRTSLSNLGSGIVDFLTGALKGIVDNAVAVKDAIIEFLTGAIKGVIDNAIAVKDSIVEFLTGAFEWLIDGISELFSDFLEAWKEYMEEKNAIGEMWSKLGQTLQKLLDTFANIVIDPITEFFASLSSGAIAIWTSFIDFPIIKELILAVVAVSFIGGIFKLFLSL